YSLKVTIILFLNTSTYLHIVIYLNNTLVIRSLRNTLLPLLQITFLKFQILYKFYGLINIRWVPGYKSIIENKIINEFAKAGAEKRKVTNRRVITLIYSKRFTKREV
ncbi:hypothetical protein QR685DRAFT_431543, partial [Neurospora intermedia]